MVIRKSVNPLNHIIIIYVCSVHDVFSPVEQTSNKSVQKAKRQKMTYTLQKMLSALYGAKIGVYDVFTVCSHYYT